MSEQSRYIQPKDVSQSVQVLRYRGVFYIPQRLSNLRRANAIEYLLNDSTQLEVSQRNCAIPIEPMGYLYKLYCMGWKNGSLKCFPVLQHWLLSIFLYYRRGYTKGFQWRQQHYLASLETEIKLPSDRDF